MSLAIATQWVPWSAGRAPRPGAPIYASSVLASAQSVGRLRARLRLLGSCGATVTTPSATYVTIADLAVTASDYDSGSLSLLTYSADADVRVTVTDGTTTVTSTLSRAGVLGTTTATLSVSGLTASRAWRILVEARRIATTATVAGWSITETTHTAGTLR